MPDQPYSSNQPHRTYPQPDDFVTSADPAVELIRQKIHNLYAEEPDAAQEVAEAVQHTHPESKHQQYMSELQATGMSAVEIQSAWHIYYSGLPDHEKYAVWQEFYARDQPQQPLATQPQTVVQQPAVVPAQHELRQRSQQRAVQQKRGRGERLVAATVNGEGIAAVKKHLLNTVKTAAGGGNGRKLTAKHHLQSLFFGLGFGGLVIFIFLFGFFNQLIIAPLLQPSRKLNDTPVIVNTASVIVDGNKVIIPKINLEIPVDYSQTTTSESAIELALDNGIVHYPTTVKPGQIGNAAFFGHSSNNIFNPGKYKFAFAFLHTLVVGDTFYLSRDGTTYGYKVFSTKIVSPKEVGVLLPIAGHTATATLITCDPPGTSINRLIVVGDQISPDPNTNGQPTTPQQTASSATTTSSALPGNGPSLWSRLVGSIF